MKRKLGVSASHKKKGLNSLVVGLKDLVSAELIKEVLSKCKIEYVSTQVRKPADSQKAGQCQEQLEILMFVLNPKPPKVLFQQIAGKWYSDFPNILVLTGTRAIQPKGFNVFRKDPVLKMNRKFRTKTRFSNIDGKAFPSARSSRHTILPKLYLWNFSATRSN